MREYKYRLNKKSRIITWIVSVVIAALIIFFSFYSTSGYLPAWFGTLVLAVLALYVLSIPRFVRVDEEALEIHCLVELTTIKIEDIQSIRRADKSELKYSIPILGSYGFFGYYGYYYNLKEMSIFKIYASEWDNFVRIEDIYEDVYIINCDNPDELIHYACKYRDDKLIEQGKQPYA